MLRIILTTGFVLSSFLGSAQIEILPLTFDLSDNKSLLSRLFDADTIAPNGEALWEPLTFADELSANLSDDGWMHTRLDTVLYFSSFEVERAVVVFETLHYEQGKINDCSDCGVLLSVAILVKTDTNNWHLERFSKHRTALGGEGMGGVVGLAQFGENQWCLSLEMSWTSQGVYAEYLAFLNLDDLEKVFNLVIHEDNLGILGLEAERTYAYDKAIHLLPSVETVSGWWEFDLVTQGTEPDLDIDRAIPANTVARFAYNWETGTYMKICP